MSKACPNMCLASIQELNGRAWNMQPAASTDYELAAGGVPAISLEMWVLCEVRMPEAARSMVMTFLAVSPARVVRMP